MNFFPHLRQFWLTLTGLLLVGGSTQAAMVLVDISAAQIVSNPAGDGKYWNSIGSGTTDASIANLVDLNNDLSGISLTIDVTNIDSGGTSGAGFGGGGVDGPAGADPFDEFNAHDDGLFANNDNNGTAVFIFTGLAASTQYDFSAIGGRASNGVDGQIIILDSATPIGSGSVGARDNYQLLNDGTVLNFSTTSTAGGEIWFEFRGQIGNSPPSNATFNAFSMTQVPEPSAALLGLLGSMLLLRRRRCS